MLQEKKLSLNDFNFFVPQSQIAQFPHEKRTDSRLLLRATNSTLQHYNVNDLPDILPRNTLVIFNDTKVFPSRLVGKLKTGAKVELFLLDLPGDQHKQIVKAIGKPLKKLKKDVIVYFEHGVHARILEKHLDGHNSFLKVELNSNSMPLQNWLNDYGIVPLPPYIKRTEDSAQHNRYDHERYQTVYANETGSVAAPTAGLHFNDELLQELQKNEIDYDYITLHVGLGTFLPVKSEDLSLHKMHQEQFKVPLRTWKKILEAKKTGKKIISVGTTSFRSLETFYQIACKNGDGMTKCDDWHSSDLFIRPETSLSKYKSHIFDGIITNFHQPCSTLFMMISALLGYEETLNMYQEAIKNKYRFYSYGDTSLLWF